MNQKFKQAFDALQQFCETESFIGYDPYDGLNSRFFQSLPLLPRYRFPRLVWIQFFKRSPINLRKLVGIKKEANPKALGLFLSSYSLLYKCDPKPEYLDKIHSFSKSILKAVSPGYSGACWGYNFDWESKAFFQPRFTPTIVASVFVASALLDAYEITGDDTLLTAARSTCNFILKDLNRTYDNEGNFAFSYSKLDKSAVFNASLLGCRLLARVYSFTGENELIEEARSAVAFCCKHQQPNGSWAYSTYSFHQWIDNFHTGYNLECINDYAQFSGDQSFNQYVEKGLQYYLQTFFTAEGIARYYNNSTYPIDVHAPAQLMVTLHKLGRFNENRALADRVLTWAIDHMQDSKGYFIYQINKFFTSRIPYMRWSQAWMFYAFSNYMAAEQAITAPKTQKALV